MKEEILSLLSPDYPWKDSFLYFDTIDSTNNYLKKQAALGAPEGTLAVADCQTGGRGRLGRSFQSPSGMGIYMSVLLRPNCAPDKIMHLTCAAAVAMCDAMEASTGRRPGIKWTNDLVCDKKKIAGILTELAMAPNGTVDYAVIGIGVNCCQKKTDFPEAIQETAGSLAMVTGSEISRPRVAAAMMDSFASMNASLFTGKDAMLDAYRADCITLGQQISLVRGDNVRHGTALDIGDDGDLIVRFEDGTVSPVSSGEVSVRGLYGYV